MKTRHYRDLQIWQCSMDLVRQIYSATGNFPKQEIFGLASQLRRAAVSIPSNIAEGQGRGTDRSFTLFLKQARGSLFELQTQIELARDLSLIEPHEADKLLHETVEIARMLNGLLRTLSANCTDAS